MISTIQQKRKCQILPRSSVLALSSYDAPLEGRLNAVRLDFNESTSPVADVYPQGLPGDWVSMYPEYSVLIDRLAEFYNQPVERFIVTNGSDEGISLISNTFIEFGNDTAVISTPCFFMLRQCLLLAGAKLDEVAVLPDLEFDIDAIEQRFQQSPKLAMFASPDNPTGSVIPVETIDRWCQKFPNTLFVIDEAYGEFAGTTVIPLVDKYSNLIVLKTFSKAWGMAGLRLGMMVGDKELIQYVNRVRLPYSVNAAAIFTALRLLDCEKDMIARVEETIEQRQKLAGFLNDNCYSVRETSANWCLLGAGMLAEDLTDFARKNGILIRNRSKSRLPQPEDVMWGRVRVSAGNETEMLKFKSTIEAFRKNFALIFDLDGTLVDTSQSFDETVVYLVKKFSGVEIELGELYALRREGGFNDDWVSSQELLRRRGIQIDMTDIARSGEEYYLSIAEDREELLIEESLLGKLNFRNQIFIVTGRKRREYAPVWGSRLDLIFNQVYCSDDAPGFAPKPAPDYLLKLMADYGIENGAYVGNSVDDMQAARAAGLYAIGIASGDNVSALNDAGAQIVLSSCNQLAQLFMVP